MYILYYSQNCLQGAAAPNVQYKGLDRFDSGDLASSRHALFHTCCKIHFSVHKPILNLWHTTILLLV